MSHIYAVTPEGKDLFRLETDDDITPRVGEVISRDSDEFIVVAVRYSVSEQPVYEFTEGAGMYPVSVGSRTIIQQIQIVLKPHLQ